MHHTVAYTVAIGQTVNTDITAVTDGIFYVQNAHFVPQRDYRLVYAYAGSATLNRVRVVSPKNRQITLPFIRPVRVGTLPGAEPRVADYREYPFVIRALEELALEGTSDLAMGTEQLSAILGLQSVHEPVPQSDIWTIRGTSVTAAVARTWTPVTVAWADTLPTGQYACCGLHYSATNAIAARMQFENQYERPGVVGTVALGDMPHRMFFGGGLGVFGRFRSTAMPLMEIYNNAVDAAHTFFMHFVRVG